ncbi:Hypothetical predicted protein [Mytilus galloprovincialis]|uniref:Uncharacterized protein n=1 Tax=Mytilus galloprovincialis TaxID=29158 RepID=A0A8B6DTP3_MYTGA|nr:Hypothetical predicted protein [Mytilus galloprovincialis]
MKNFFDNPEIVHSGGKTQVFLLHHLITQDADRMKAKRRLIALEQHDLSAFKKVKITEASKPVYMSSDEEGQEGYVQELFKDLLFRKKRLMSFSEVIEERRRDDKVRPPPLSHSKTHLPKTDIVDSHTSINTH